MSQHAAPVKKNAVDSSSTYNGETDPVKKNAVDSSNTYNDETDPVKKNAADSCSHGLMEQMALLGLSKVSAALADCSTQVELPALAVGLLNRLRHLLEKLTSVASVRHSPLLWRLLIWAASLLTSRLEAKDAAEELKTVLYRAIQVMQRCSQFVRDINNVYFRMCPGTRHYTLTLPSTSIVGASYIRQHQRR